MFFGGIDGEMLLKMVLKALWLGVRESILWVFGNSIGNLEELRVRLKV
jgi:hypothetical protein